jgi:hypothetical protein
MNVGLGMGLERLVRSIHDRLEPLVVNAEAMPPMLGRFRVL